jgi:Mn2+/Fe2+ NRAMP family transporter
MTVGFAINLAGLDAVKMLFWSAVVNGLLAPPLILLILLLTSDRHVMSDRINSRIERIAGWVAFAIMTAAAAGLLFA